MRARTLRAVAHVKAALEHLHAAERLLMKDYDYENNRVAETVRAGFTPLIAALKTKIAELFWRSTESAKN